MKRLNQLLKTSDQLVNNITAKLDLLQQRLSYFENLLNEKDKSN